MKLFKSVLKNGLKNNAIRFKFEAGSICEFEKDDGEIAIDQRDIPDQTLLKELFAAFFPRDAEALAQGKPVRGVLSVVNHGDLILLGVPGATPRLEVFVPPHAERLF